ncbi:hypothetical protein MTYM_01450 [Methylococcales bacterium]|nr:hypothetical protein MTYM_01450 [Methylococcales bacterium]
MFFKSIFPPVRGNLLPFKHPLRLRMLDFFPSHAVCASRTIFNMRNSFACVYRQSRHTLRLQFHDVFNIPRTMQNADYFNARL